MMLLVMILIQIIQYIRKDDAIWETQMYPKPRDIPQGYRGEVRKFWVLRKLRTKIK